MEAGCAVKWEMTLIPHRAHLSSKRKPPSPLTWRVTTATISCVLTANDIFKISTELGNFFWLKSYNDFIFQSWHITPCSFAPAWIISQPHISFHFYHKLSAHWPFRCVNGPSLCLALLTFTPLLFPRTIRRSASSARDTIRSLLYHEHNTYIQHTHNTHTDWK